MGSGGYMYSTVLGEFVAREYRAQLLGGWKNQRGSRKSAGFMSFEGFPDIFSFSGDRFADTFLDMSVERTRQSEREQPQCRRSKKGVP